MNPDRLTAVHANGWATRAAVAGAALIATAVLAMAVLDARHGTLRGDVTGTALVWFAVGVAGFALAAVANERRPIPVRWIWIGAVIFRLILAVTEPTLSDDVQRYLWEGHLVTEGVSPYAAPIDDPSLDHLAVEARDLANNPELASPYLPVAHALFAAVVWLLPDTVTSMQVVMIGFDLIAVALLARVLDRLGHPRSRMLLYAWNPLVIVEIAHGAHLDAAIVALVLLAVLATLERPAARWWWPVAPAAGAAAVLVRPTPLLLVPLLWCWWDRRQRVLHAAAVLAPVVVTGMAVGWGLGSPATGTGVFGSARVYAETFVFNNAIHSLVSDAVGLVVDDPSRTARGVAALAAVAVVVACTIRVTRELAERGPGREAARATARLLALPLMAYVLLTPVLHPWYLVLLLALVPSLAPVDGEPGLRWVLLAPWAYLAASIPLSYLTYRDPDAFAELDVVRAVEWVPTAALLVVAGWIASRLHVRDGELA